MNAAIIGTTDVISPVAAGPAAGADRPVVDKEAGLDAIVENFDGFVWSVNRDFQYIVLNSALRKKDEGAVACRHTGKARHWRGVFWTTYVI